MELMDGQSAVRKNKINLKKEVLKFLRYWYWIVLSIIVFFLGAKIYLRYVTPQYLSKTTLQFPQSNTKGNAALSDLQTLGNGLSEDSELQGETTAILAKPNLAKVVGKLNLNVSFFTVGAIKEIELYTSSPIQGKIISIADPKFSAVSYLITPVGHNSYKLSEGPLLKGKSTFSFGEFAALPFGKVVISLKPGRKNFETVKVIFKSTQNMVSALENAVSVVLPANKGLLMELSLTGAIPAKSEDVLNSITQQYNSEGVKDRSLEAQNTQDFINGRLEIISRDLGGIENEKENFKRSNEITDLDAQASMALTNSNDNTKQYVLYATQLDLINSIYNASASEQLLPTNLGLSSATEGYIAKYNDMLLTRNKTLKQATNKNPSIIQLNRDIAEIRGLIRENLLESKSTLQIQIAQLKGQLNADRTRIYNYPTQEKIFRGIERQQTLKEQLYLYLLQKREENAITLAVTAPKAKILNPAYTIGIIKPNKQQIMMGALLAGLLLPLLILYAKYASDNKVHTKDELQSYIPNASVIAEIPAKQDGGLVLLTQNDFTVFAESFRILTSNLKFLLRSKEIKQSCGVILVTSSIKGEGKTAVAMNTALTLAGSSKVLIIGADIRNPQLHRFVKESEKGLTDYLISEDEVPDSYIVPSRLHPNLEILFSGAIAPNPNDLLDMKKFDTMIDKLKDHYQYIILDSAPVMLVSDTLHLMPHADVVLYIVKAGYTGHQMLGFADEFQKTHDIKNISFVLNNVMPEDSRYGSRYGYYSPARTETKLAKLFKRK